MKSPGAEDSNLFHGRRLALTVGFAFLARMDLETARRYIQISLERMRAAYLQPVFDEWAILALTTKVAGAPKASGGILAYQGPRPDGFRRNLGQDAEPLRMRAAGREFSEGDIEFVPDAANTFYDAFMKIGPSSYLVLNHTTKTLDEIRADTKWLGVQGVLFELSEKFRADGLDVST